MRHYHFVEKSAPVAFAKMPYDDMTQTCSLYMSLYAQFVNKLHDDGVDYDSIKEVVVDEYVKGIFAYKNILVYEEE